MPATRPIRSRIERKTTVPHGLVTSWSVASSRDKQPRARRPIKACDTCRMARVKCDNGQPECQRCIERGIVCDYSAIKIASHNESLTVTNSVRQVYQPWTDHQEAAESVPAQSGSTVWQDQLPGIVSNSSSGIPENSPAGLDAAIFDAMYADSLLEMTANENLVEWSHELEGQLGHSRADMQHFLLDPAPTRIMDLSGIDQHAFDIPELDNPPDTAQTPRAPNRDCQCRQHLLIQVPAIKNVMQLPRPKLGNVYKITQDVIQRCQNLMECVHCQLNWSDILCIMAVFQPTQACFTYLSRHDINSPLKVSIDDHELVLSDGATLRRVLITDLLRQAAYFLSCLKALGLKVMQKELPEGSLCKINLDYLNNAIGDCEAILHTATNLMNGNDNRNSNVTGLALA